MRKIYLLWAWLAIASAVPQEMPRKTREDAAIRKRDDWMSVSVKIVGSMLTIAALWRPTQRALSDLRGRRRARPNLPPQSNAAQPPEPPPQVPEVPLAPPVPPHSKTLPEVFDALVNDTPDQLKWCIVLDCLGLVPDENGNFEAKIRIEDWNKCVDECGGSKMLKIEKKSSQGDTGTDKSPPPGNAFSARQPSWSHFSGLRNGLARAGDGLARGVTVGLGLLGAAWALGTKGGSSARAI